MKNENADDLKICPRCHNAYHGVPALSRKDGLRYTRGIGQYRH